MTLKDARKLLVMAVVLVIACATPIFFLTIGPGVYVASRLLSYLVGVLLVILFERQAIFIKSKAKILFYLSFGALVFFLMTASCIFF